MHAVVGTSIFGVISGVAVLLDFGVRKLQTYDIGGVIILGLKAAEYGLFVTDVILFGDPRTLDVRTGKLRWRFHTLPQPGEAGNATWGPEGWKDRSGPSQWGFATVDVQRGMVFLPIGNPADSFYGADRKGTNLCANSVIALDALTGKLRWYYRSKGRREAQLVLSVEKRR